MKTTHSTLLVCACLALFSGCSGEDRALDRGMDEIRAGRYDRAVRSLRKATLSDPRRATAFCNLGIASWRAGDLEGASDALKSALEYSGDPRPWEYLGRVLLEQGRDDEARSALERARSVRPSPPCLTALGLLEMRAGRYQAATNALMSALSIEPAYRPALYNMAMATRGQSGNLDLAKTWAGRYLEEAGADPRANRVRSLFSEEGPSVPEQVASTRVPAPVRTAAPRAAAVSPPPALPPQPSEQFPPERRAAAAREPQAPPTSAVVRAVPPASDRRQEALRLWAEALKHHKANQLDEAIAGYIAALRADGTLVSASYNLGLVYTTKGDNVRARDAFLAAVSVKPDMLDARYMLASCLRNMRETDKALVEARKLLQIDDSYSKAHLLLGIIYREQGHARLARQHLERFIRLDPNSPMAGKARGWIGEMR